jgi:hypothetical protein
MGSIERQLNRAIIRLRETQTQRRKEEAPRRLKTMSATATEFVSSPSPQLITDHELVTSHQPVATSEAEPLALAEQRC